MNPSEISACLITKDSVYPERVLLDVVRHGFGEILLLTGCDSPHRKQELFAKAKYETIYYQDDDCIAPIQELLTQAVRGKITCAMKAGHIAAYANSKIALLGWGAIFDRSVTAVLDYYRAVWGEDEVYRRETERIMTALNWEIQNRLCLPIVDLPSAIAPDRLSMQPGHFSYIPVVEERCNVILASMAVAR